MRELTGVFSAHSSQTHRSLLLAAQNQRRANCSSAAEQVVLQLTNKKCIRTACPSELAPLAFVVNRFFMKMFGTVVR